MPNDRQEPNQDIAASSSTAVESGPKDKQDLTGMFSTPERHELSSESDKETADSIRDKIRQLDSQGTVTPKKRLEGEYEGLIGNERDRGLYEGFLGVETRDLKGQKVLNIGCGMTGVYEKIMARHGADVYALSPSLLSPQGAVMREWYRETPKMGLKERLRYILDRALGKIPEIKLLAGYVEDGIKMPDGEKMADDAFDKVLALYSVPLWVDETYYPQLFWEILRVMKPGGLTAIYPIPEDHIETIRMILETCGAKKLTFEEVKEKPGGNAVYLNEDRKSFRLTFEKEKDKAAAE